MQRDVAIVGVGLHPWGRYPEKKMQEMGAVAIINALKDAKIKWTEIDGIVAGAYHWDHVYGGMYGLLAGNALSMAFGELNVPVYNVANACATGGSVISVGYMMIASGLHDVVLAVAADKSGLGFFPPKSRDKDDVDYVRYSMTGETNPAYWAMELRRRWFELGLDEKENERLLAKPKAMLSEAGARNPYARYKRKFTIEEVLKSPMVADPFRLYMICSTSDGAAAMILTTLEKAKKITDKPVLIEGATCVSSKFGEPCTRLPTMSSFPRHGVPRLSDARKAVERVYKLSGRRPDEIDVIEQPDHSPWHYFEYLEVVLQLSENERGTAEKMVEKEETHPLTGKVPVCPSGGASSFGEVLTADGIMRVCELVWQLRGQAGERQIKKDLKVGLAITYGYMGNNAAVVVSKAW